MTIEYKKTQPGSTEAVQFSDGMLVTAEDLTAAMRYPLSVIQVLLKAYFGCGIVCGLDLNNPAEGKAAETTKGERDPATGASTKAAPVPNFILTVEKGVALGCDGYPIEICGPLKLDLTLDPCSRDKEKELFIAVRRVTTAEATARACGCGSTGGEPAQQCTRMRDHALVQAFDEVPPGICRIAPPAKDGEKGAERGQTSAASPTGLAAVCACMKQCGECDCRGEPWVLLGSVMVREGGMDPIDRSGRRYVKPIACICDTVARDQVQPATPAKPIVDKKTPPDEPPGEGTTS
ncbi:MAG TPA: hypothetical protein VGD66_04685 [Allosphingosinicella sp.]|jgi:hypothetical protein